MYLLLRGRVIGAPVDVSHSQFGLPSGMIWSLALTGPSPTSRLRLEIGAGWPAVTLTLAR